MAWTCEQTEDRLLEAMEGTLEAGERAEMDRHVAECVGCRRLEESVRQAVGSLRRLDPVEAPAWLAAAIIRRTRPSQPTRRRTGWLDLFAQPRLILGAVAVLITFSVVFHTLTGKAPSALAAMNPTRIYRQFDRRAHLAYAHGVKFLSDLRLVYEIQSRFQPASTSQPSETPEKKSTDQLHWLYYGRLESRFQRAGARVDGDKHEMRYPS